MSIDIYAKSQELLEALANSVYDRDPKTTNPFYFNINEIQLTERWLLNFIEEIKRDCVCV